MIIFNTTTLSFIGKTNKPLLSFGQTNKSVVVNVAPELSDEKGDVFELSKNEAVQNPVNVNKLNKPNAANKISYKVLKKQYDELVEKKLIPEELIEALKPVRGLANEYRFFPTQAKVIEAASVRMKVYDRISEQLAKEALDAETEVHNQVKDLFGGDEGLGKYVVIRTKSKTSIFNKLVKEYKDNDFYGDFMDRFAKPAFKKPYSKLTDDEKKLILLSFQDKSMSMTYLDLEDIAKMFKPSSKAHEKAIVYVKDLVGTRLILPTGNEEEMDKVEKYISKAIKNNKIKITRMSNYHANYILPYINYKTAQRWKDAMPGMVLVENSKVRKKNGYTTTQLNLVHTLENKEASKAKDLSKSKISKKAQTVEKNKLKSKTILGELQIRTKKLNDIGQIEHLIYDILEGKDISSGIPELQKYYDSIGIVDAVNEVFNDEEKENMYLQYERTMYSFTRHNELERQQRNKYRKPRLEMFNLGNYEILSFESLAKIDRQAELYKKLHKSQPEEER